MSSSYDIVIEVEWKNTFLLFWKTGHYAADQVFFMSPIPKNQQSFNFQKLTGILKIHVFGLKICKKCPTVLLQGTKRKFEIKFFKIFLVALHQNKKQH